MTMKHSEFFEFTKVLSGAVSYLLAERARAQAANENAHSLEGIVVMMARKLQ